jgi:hypothetical protein
MVVMQKEEGEESQIPTAPAVKESKTEVLFLLGRHAKEYVQKLKDITDKRRPDFIILEEPFNDRFQKLLEKGKTQNIEKDIKEYVETGGYSFKDVEIEKIKVLSELYNKGTIIIQLDPGRERLPPIDFRTSAAFRLGKYIEFNDFKMAVNASIVYSAVETIEIHIRDRERVAAITKLIDDGKIHGYILVEAGSAHTFFKDAVMDHFKNSKSVTMSSQYVTPKEVKELFGSLAQEVYSPSHELSRLYESGLYGPLNKSWNKKWMNRWVRDGYGIEYAEDRSFLRRAADKLVHSGDYGDERERLLAAREVIAYKMVSDAVDSEEMIRTTSIVNRLGYKECEDIFYKTKGMSDKETFEFIKSHVKARKQDFSVGG